MPIDTAPVKTLVDDVEAAIRQHIRDNNLKAGDALPNEGEFAVNFGVSRNVVREAVSRLRMLDMVESRARRGMTLASPNPFVGLTRVVETGILDETAQEDMFHFRVVVEVGMASYVFANRTPEHLAALEATLASACDHNGNAELEVAFHSRLYDMSGIPLLAPLKNILPAFFRGLPDAPDLPEEEWVSHRRLFRTLKEGTAEEFQLFMRRHLMVYLPPVAGV